MSFSSLLQPGSKHLFLEELKRPSAWACVPSTLLFLIPLIDQSHIYPSIHLSISSSSPNLLSTHLSPSPPNSVLGEFLISHPSTPPVNKLSKLLKTKTMNRINPILGLVCQTGHSARHLFSQGCLSLSIVCLVSYLWMHEPWFASR